MVTEEKVWEKLRLVIDPELGIDIVELGLVYEVRVVKEEERGENGKGKSDVQKEEEDLRFKMQDLREQQEIQASDFKDEELQIQGNTTEPAIVKIVMTLTSPHCPLAGMFDDLVSGAVRQIEDVKRVDIELTFDPPWDMSKASEQARAEMGFF